MEANLAKPQASTGPKSAGGKLRAARNSRRHGLSVPLLRDSKLTAEVEAAALEIAGLNASPQRLTLARQIAEPQIDLLRVRQARHDLMSNFVENPISVLTTKAAFARYARVLTAFREVMNEEERMPRVFSRLIQGLKERERFALFTAKESQSMAAMDRYEKRAISRRKTGIRAFDAAQPALGEITPSTDAGAGMP